MKMKQLIGILALAVVSLSTVNAQQHLDPAYIKVTQERAAKIVDKMEVKSAKKSKKVIDIIAQQYRDLSQLHDSRDAEIKNVKASSATKEEKNTQIETLKERTDVKIAALHESYIKKLNKYLSEEQVDQVKDGMTYNVLHGTYDGYLDMLVNLTDEQKEYIMKNLIEAREKAMDGGSSKEKHGWFGKYKGRINNYLSAQGYDLNKESADWHKRLEERKKNKQQ